MRSLSEYRLDINSGLYLTDGGVAPVITPLTLITSVPVIQWIRGDLGVTLGTGMAAIADQSGSGNHFTQVTGSAQPPYTSVDATLNNRPSFAGDGVNDTLLNSTMPNGQGIWISGILKTITWTTNKAAWGCNAAPECGDLLSITGTPTLALYNGSSTNNQNNGLPVGSWGRAEAWYQGASSYLKLRSNTVTSGVAIGTTTSVGCALFSTLGVAFGRYAMGERVVTLGKPTGAEIINLDAYYANLYTLANVA